jgi:flavin-binding protein dodecin
MMGNKSSITQLPEPIREAVDRAIRENRATIDDITGMINEMGGDVSRSAVGRYVKNANDQMEKYKQAQAVATTWIGKIEENPEGDVGRLLSEMLRTVAFQTISTMGDSEDGSAPMDIMLLAKAMKDLAGADKLTVDKAYRIRQEARKQATEEAAQRAEETALAQGMSEEQARFWREKVLGGI